MNFINNKFYNYKQKGLLLELYNLDIEYEFLKNEIENNQFDYVKKMKENNEKEDKENNKEKKI